MKSSNWQEVDAVYEVNAGGSAGSDLDSRLSHEAGDVPGTIHPDRPTGPFLLPAKIATYTGHQPPYQRA